MSKIYLKNTTTDKCHEITTQGNTDPASKTERSKCKYSGILTDGPSERVHIRPTPHCKGSLVFILRGDHQWTHVSRDLPRSTYLYGAPHKLSAQ